MKTQLEVVKHNEKTEIAITGGRLVAEMFEGEEHRAEQIVRAVNCHDELLFSLEYCYRKLNELVKSGKISEPLLLDEVPDLLKRAKGGES